MNIKAWAIAALAISAVCAAGCEDDAPEGEPQTIRETGYLSCQDGGGDCPGAFLCETQEMTTECVGFPDDCNELTCACVAETICGDSGCHEVDGGVLCEPAPFVPCAGKVCGDPCSLCAPDDPDCTMTLEEKACNLEGECVSDTGDLCGGAGVVCEGTPEELSCGEGEICCEDRCCAGNEQCCTGIPVPAGQGLCLPLDQSCPRSRRALKKDIRYTTSEEAAGYSAQIQAIRLSTWHYKDEPSSAPRHLGFIIEDGPGPHTVAADGEHVDLYGYTSLAVAALQDQARQIEAMKAELKALREEIAAVKASAAGRSTP